MIHHGRFTAIVALIVVGLNTAAGAPATDRYFRADRGVARSWEGSGYPEDLNDARALRWRVALDPGHSTPIRVAGRLVVTTVRPASRELATVALEEESGRVLWRRPVEVARFEETHAVGSPATPTPASDGQRVFVFFGSYGLICYDLEGNRVWEVRMGPFQDEYGAGSSPIVVEGRVILQQDHDVDSFVAAYDVATGRRLWRTPRPDAVRSYSTPAVWERGGRKELLVAGALELAAYDLSDGANLWTYAGLARLVIPTPVPDGDRVFMASWAPGADAGRRIQLEPWASAVGKWDADRDGHLAQGEVADREVLDRFFRMDLNQDGRLSEAEWERHASVFRRAQNALVALEPRGTGRLPDDAVVWKHGRGVPYVASPLVSGGGVWMVRDGGIVTCVEAETGRLRHEERVPGMGSYFASPVAGDGKVYLASEQGVVSVVADAPEWRVLSSRDFAEKIYATPVLEDGHLLIRTEKALHRFGRPSAP